MDAWLTRLLAPKPARHGTIIWWQGENAAAALCEALKERNIAHALAFGQGSEPMAALTDALVAAGLDVEWVQGKTPQARGDRTVILTDGAGYPQAAQLAEALRRQAKRDASRLQPIRKADAAETDEPDPPEGKISYALNIEDALREEMQTSPLTTEVPETEPASVAEDTEAMLEQAEATAAEEVSSEEASDVTVEDAATASEAPAQEPTVQASAEPSDTTIPIPAPTQELVAQEAPEESYAGAAMLVLVPHRLDVLPFASMSAPPDGVVFMPGFAGNVTEAHLRDARLSALATAVETLICRKISQQVRRDAQEALSLMGQEPLTAELVARMTLLAGAPTGYACCLGTAVHEAHPGVPLGEARLACLRELLRRYGTDARHGLHLCSLGVGCGGEKASPESNSTAFLQWLDNACAAWGVTSAWRCLRNNELPGLAQSVLKQVKLAAPKHLSAQAFAETLAALKVQETDGFATEQLCEKQRAYFDQGKTLSLDFRFHRLEAVKRWMDTHEEAIQEALFADLGKSAFEAYETEIMLVREELHYLRTHLSSLAATAWYHAPITQWPSRCFTVQEPYGQVLIMAPWNYPFLLSVDPLLAAIAAGNCVVLKPSAYAPATSKLLHEMVSELFDPEYVAVVEGGRAENQSLLEQKFDYIFFTGSVDVGKIVMTAAAQHLTPVTLELGGKSPCLVDETADLALAAKRIIWGKYINAGQTCVAPDYILCHESVKEKLLEALKEQVRRFWGAEPLKNPELPRLVNRKHFDRLCGYLANGQVEIGGHTSEETLQMEPTVLSGVSWDDAVMQEEIFGPVLPVLTYGDFDALLTFLRTRPKSLAGYLFTRSTEHEDAFLKRLSFGGGCINDVLCHLATTCLPFGGVGESGMGSYHGRRSFETFSHTKPVLKKSLRVDVPVRYPPYKNKRKWLKRLSR